MPARTRPGDARRRDRHIDAGIAGFSRGRMDDALGEFLAACRLDPSDHRGHVNAAATLVRLGRFRDAAREARAAIRVAPSCPEAHDNLGVALKAMGHHDAAVGAHREACRLAPADPGFDNNLAVALEATGRLEEALPVWERAVARDPGSIPARIGLGMVQLATGRFADGWRNYEARHGRLPCNGRLSPSIPMWDGTPIDGPLLLCSTDGFGDAVMGIRHAALCRSRCRETIVRCPAHFARTLARVEGVDRVVPDTEPFPEAAAQASIHSLPGVVGKPEPWWGGPYIAPDEDDVVGYADLFRCTHEPKLVVGCVWQGDPNHCDDRRRSFRLAELAPLAAAPGATLVSLQMGRGAEQVDESPFAGFIRLGDYESYRDGDYLETAAAIAACDLIVAPDTGIAHLAAAMGKPTWVALCRAGEWRWLDDREDSPWYPSMRLYRQERHGDWPGVFARMADELAKVA